MEIKMRKIMYCINCGKKNEIPNHEVQDKCVGCGKFLCKPIHINPLQKKTSVTIYKDVRIKK